MKICDIRLKRNIYFEIDVNRIKGKYYLLKARTKKENLEQTSFRNIAKVFNDGKIEYLRQSAKVDFLVNEMIYSLKHYLKYGIK